MKSERNKAEQVLTGHPHEDLKESGFESTPSPIHTFDSGAKRSQLMLRYDLIPRIALERIAARFEMGLSLYGEHNYKLGLSFDDTFNHIIDHLERFKDRVKEARRELEEGTLILPKGVSPIQLAIQFANENAPDGDDLAAAAWGIVALMYLEEHSRIL